MLPSPKRAYQFQKNVALQRGISWEFTYETWLAWWLDQLGLEWQLMRGRKAGQYCMARYGDAGAYNEQNVRCILHTDNTKEAAPRMCKAFRIQRGPKPCYRSKRQLKLSKEQIIAIRQTLGTNRDIAAQYGVCYSYICRIRQQKRRQLSQ